MVAISSWPRTVRTITPTTGGAAAELDHSADRRFMREKVLLDLPADHQHSPGQGHIFVIQVPAIGGKAGDLQRGQDHSQPNDRGNEEEFPGRERRQSRLWPEPDDEDVALARRVLVIGRQIEQRLFPHESPIGRVIKLGGHTYTVVGVMVERGTAFGQSQHDIATMPITRYFEDYGSANRTINVATQSYSQIDYNRAFDRGVGAMRIARRTEAEEPNDFEISPTIR